MILLIVCIIAGLGAGIGTGLAGLSAAVVISPMLITFCGFSAYEAVGIALASDVLASAVTAYTYGKNKNLDIKKRTFDDAIRSCVYDYRQLAVLSSSEYGFRRNFLCDDFHYGYPVLSGSDYKDNIQNG